MTALTPQQEAEWIGRYLLGESPDEAEKELYVRALATLQLSLDPDEDTLWRLALRSRLLTSLIDAGLALTRPASPIRKKIYLMLAILEASPRHGQYFLPRAFGRAYGGIIFLKLIGAGLKAAAGLILLLIFRCARALWN